MEVTNNGKEEKSKGESRKEEKEKIA